VETNRPNYVQWISLALVIVILIGGAFYLPSSVGSAVQAGVGAAISSETSKIIAAIPPAPVIPAMPSVPTAAEIASLITVPAAPEAQAGSGDTNLGVRDEKKALAKKLVLEEIEDEDFREDLADYLTYNSDGEIDIQEDDITNIVIKDIDFSGFDLNLGNIVYEDTDGIVEIEMKVYFNNDGDDDEAEKVKVYVEFNVVDLVYDDNYEDAEVDGYVSLNLLRCYGDLDCII